MAFLGMAWLAAVLAAVMIGGVDRARAADKPPKTPKDMSKYLGDPDRGSEPDPKKEKGQWRPPLDPVQVSKGHPVNDYGHFRMNDKVVGKSWKPSPLITAATDGEYQQAKAAFEVKPWKNGKELLYSILTPPEDGKKPKGGWPLVIYCPGSGGVGKKAIAYKGKGKLTPELLWGTPAYREHFPAYVIHPHPQGRTLTYEDGGKVKTTPILGMYLDLIDQVVKDEPIDRDRIYVMGFSMGGSTTWQLIKERPDFFAAASPAAGSPPNTLAEVKRFKDVPIWMFMGNKDPWSGSSKYIHAYQMLSKAGAKQVRFWEIQDMAHSPAPHGLWALAEWMFAQRRGGK